MLCVADYLDALAWVDSIGGLSGAIARSQASLRVIADAVAQWPWLHFLAQDPSTISNTSVCLSVDATPEQVTQLAKLLEREQVAYDIGAYRDAPPGLRIWCGATVEPSDVAALMEWLEWGYHHVTTSH